MRRELPLLPRFGLAIIKNRVFRDYLLHFNISGIIATFINAKKGSERRVKYVVAGAAVVIEEDEVRGAPNSQ